MFSWKAKTCPLCGGPPISRGRIQADRQACGPCWVQRAEVWVEHCPDQPSELWARMTPGKGTLKLRKLGTLNHQDYPGELPHLLGLPLPRIREVENPWPQQYRCNRCGESFNGMCMGSGVCYGCWDS